MNNPYGYTPEQTRSYASVTFASLIQKVYTWMALALAITGMTAYYVAHNENLLFSIVGNSGVLIFLLIAEVALVFGMSFFINKISFAVAGIIFGIYSLLNGVTFATIFLVYTASSIASTFLITAGTFAAMSLFGYFTKRDLGTMGRICYMALIGVIIASIANIFFASSALEWAVTYLGLAIFIGLTAYDTQKMKVMLQAYLNAGQDNVMKVALMCSLSLYLDFINMFLYLLRIFGDRK